MRAACLIASCSLFVVVNPDAQANQQSAEATAKAEHLFQTRNFETAFLKFKEIQANPYTAPADLALSRCRIGIIYSIRDDQKQARYNLELALSSNVLSAVALPLCYYALAQIYVMDKSYAEARSLMQKNPDPVFPAQYKARVFALGVEVAKKLNDLEFEISQLERLARVMEMGDIKKVELKILGDWSLTLAEVKQRLGETNKPTVAATAEPTKSAVVVDQSSEPTKSAVIAEQSSVPMRSTISAEEPSTNSANSTQQPIHEQPAGKFSTDASAGAADSTSFLAVKDLLTSLRALRQGQLETALSEARTAGADSVGAKSLMGLIPFDKIRDRAESLLRNDPRNMRIGIILPAGSGTYARLQLRALKGISAFLNSRAARDVEYQVFVKTVSNDSGSSERAALELILKEKVHAIIGPFHGAQLVGAAASASFFGVPLFALGPVTSAREHDPNYLVRMGTLAQSQARAQVQFLKRQKRKTVAIMSPTDGYGVEMARAFEAVCKSEGLQIQRVEFVDESIEIFQEPVKSLLGPQDGKNRGADYWRLVTEAKKKAAQEKRKFDPSTVKAPANVPFSALFVPDSLDRVRLIANTFAFFDARSVRFLGDRTWQDASGKPSIADQFLNGARVPVPISGAFLPFLRRELSAGDSVLDIERQAFDSLLLARTAQYKAGGNNPAKLVAAMQSPDFSADGASKYGPVDSSGEPSIKFEVTQYYNGSVLSPNTSLENLATEEESAQ